jgi:hypothetical protein
MHAGLFTSPMKANMDLKNDEFERAAAHYAELAQHPGWLDYCRHRVAELEQDKCGLYVGLRAEVRKMLEAAKSQKVQVMQKPV